MQTHVADLWLLLKKKGKKWCWDGGGSENEPVSRVNIPLLLSGVGCNPSLTPVTVSPDKGTEEEINHILAPQTFLFLKKKAAMTSAAKVSRAILGRGGGVRAPAGL